MEFDMVEYLRELTHFELLESYYLARGALSNDVTAFVTVLSAYVTVAYFVSAKLSRFQAITISSLYSFFALYMASSAYNSSLTLADVAFAITGLDVSWEAVILVTILLVSWVFSIIMFIQARRVGDA